MPVTVYISVYSTNFLSNLAANLLIEFNVLIGINMRGLYLAILICLISACGGGGSAGETSTVNLPDIPTPPVSRLVLSNDYVGFLIGSQPIGVDPNLATSQQFSQHLYQLDSSDNITPVTLLDQSALAWDLTGNITFTSEEHIIPLDVMVMSDDYILLTIFHRNFDTDTDNDYYNLLVDLATGLVVGAPVGLNEEGNSGRSNLTLPGRDYFPPDSRWNDSQELYVVSVDFDELDLMTSGEFVEDPDHEELVDHHSGVPCPPALEEEDTTTDETDTAGDETTTDATDNSEDTTTDTEDSVTDDDTSTPTSGSTCVDTSTTVTTEETSAAETASTSVTANSLDNILENSASLMARATDDEEPAIPTAIYRMFLGTGGSYGLEKISAEDDRPGLGQFIVSRAGIIIYRNIDGGDNSYRVLLEHCEGITGRLSTVLLAPHTSLIVADDDQGNSSIFEITQRGMNKLLFSCNGSVTREAYSGYSVGINSLRLPYNSPSIASYDYAYPFFLNDSCDGGRLFPQQVPVSEILNPMPFIPGLPSGDVRGLRKSQMINGSLYCIGYDVGLDLSIAELDPTATSDQYQFLNYNFGFWLPNFDTVHILGNNNIIFTGTSRASSEVNTIMLNIDGTQTNLNDTLLGFKVMQQIEITPPPITTTP